MTGSGVDGPDRFNIQTGRALRFPWRRPPCCPPFRRRGGEQMPGKKTPAKKAAPKKAAPKVEAKKIEAQPAEAAAVKTEPGTVQVHPKTPPAQSVKRRGG